MQMILVVVYAVFHALCLFNDHLVIVRRINSNPIVSQRLRLDADNARHQQEVLCSLLLESCACRRGGPEILQAAGTHSPSAFRTFVSDKVKGAHLSRFPCLDHNSSGHIGRSHMVIGHLLSPDC